MPMIEKPEKYRIALLHLGFRPFFLASASFALIAMALWMLLYDAAGASLVPSLPPPIWHAHEMIFGYTLGVIAGFLLTAARNWTNVQTSRGIVLLLLVTLWAVPRISIFSHTAWTMSLTAVCDLVFDCALVAAIAYPIIRVRQWKQLGIVGLVLAIAIANAFFYAELVSALRNGIAIGLDLGINAAILLVLLMGRRVIPFFIEKGLNIPALRNRTWLDTSILTLMAIDTLMDILGVEPLLPVIFTAMIAILQAARLWDWYRPEIWRKPLLWSLFMAFVWLDIGFLLKVLSYFDLIPSSLALHAFAIGGLGLITFSMMCRVTLGHTGRDVFNPPVSLLPLLTLLNVAAVVRVFFPWMLPDDTKLWIAISQVVWILAFAGFIWVFSKILILPRIDGRYG